MQLLGQAFFSRIIITNYSARFESYKSNQVMWLFQLSLTWTFLFIHAKCFSTNGTVDEFFVR